MQWFYTALIDESQKNSMQVDQFLSTLSTFGFLSYLCCSEIAHFWKSGRQLMLCRLPFIFFVLEPADDCLSVTCPDGHSFALARAASS